MTTSDRSGTDAGSGRRPRRRRRRRRCPRAPSSSPTMSALVCSAQFDLDRRVAAQELRQVLRQVLHDGEIDATSRCCPSRRREGSQLRVQRLDVVHHRSRIARDRRGRQASARRRAWSDAAARAAHRLSISRCGGSRPKARCAASRPRATGFPRVRWPRSASGTTGSGGPGRDAGSWFPGVTTAALPARQRRVKKCRSTCCARIVSIRAASTDTGDPTAMQQILNLRDLEMIERVHARGGKFRYYPWLCGHGRRGRQLLPAVLGDLQRLRLAAPPAQLRPDPGAARRRCRLRRATAS